MRYGKITAYFFTAIFLAVAVFFYTKELEWDGSVSLSVVVSSQQGAEEITCWEDDAGEYYIFLPSYADPSQVQIRTNAHVPIRIDDQPLEDGMSCDAFSLNTPHDLSYTTGGNTLHFTLTFMKSANVPAMYIDVPSGSMDYIHELKGNEEPGTIRLYTADGELDHRGNLDSIKGRGNFTWNQEKKPYSLKLSAEADLLGLGQAQNWILLANAVDPSNLRTKIVFDFAEAAGLSYSPDSQFVDLYLNGEYAGLYQLSERNEIHPQRVSLSEDDSFLVSMELEERLIAQSYPYISTDSGVPLRIHYSAGSESTLTQIWQSAENAILAEDGMDPITGKHWTELIDLDSWARKYLIEEIFGSVDAVAVSQYFYGSVETGKIYAGPVWDFDSSIGNSEEWQLILPTAFFANRPVLRNGIEDPWFYALCQKEMFWDRVTELYQTVFQPLLEDLLNEGISRYAAQIAQAAGMNQIRWSAIDAAAETEGIQSYMEERVAFLTGVWFEQEEYYTVLVDLKEGSNTAYFAIPPGGYLPELPVFESTADILYHGWYTSDTDKPFDITQPIYEDTQIYLKWSVRETEPAEQEPQYETEPDYETAEQPSLLRLSPVIIFAVILLILCFADKIRAKRDDTQKNG